MESVLQELVSLTSIFLFGRMRMSRGLEAVYKLLAIEDGKATYAYSGDNLDCQQ